MALRWQWRFAGSGVGWMRRQELSPGAAAPSHVLPALRTRGIWFWRKWKYLHRVSFLLGFAPVHIWLTHLSPYEPWCSKGCPRCQGGNLLVRDRDADSTDPSIDHGVRCWNDSPEPTERGQNLSLYDLNPLRKNWGCGCGGALAPGKTFSCMEENMLFLHVSFWMVLVDSFQALSRHGIVFTRKTYFSSQQFKKRSWLI